MNDLYLMCGVPGAGKSTFLKNRVKLNKNNVIISRDKIRFSLVKPHEAYFSKEKEVVKTLWDEINKELTAGHTVFVDQTSLTRKSRKWLLTHITSNYNHVNLIWIDESLKTCLERNEQRKGTRSYVPRESIISMHNNFEEPSLDEGFYRIFKYNSINDKITYKGVIL